MTLWQGIADLIRHHTICIVEDFNFTMFTVHDDQGEFQSASIRPSSIGDNNVGDITILVTWIDIDTTDNISSEHTLYI